MMQLPPLIVDAHFLRAAAPCTALIIWSSVGQLADCVHMATAEVLLHGA